MTKPALSPAGVVAFSLLLPISLWADHHDSLHKLDRALQQAVAKDSASQRVIIRAKPGRQVALRQALRALGESVEVEHESIDAVTVEIDSAADLLALAAHPAVAALSVDAVVTAGQVPDPPDELPNNFLLGTLGLLDRTVVGDGVGVAVIDSGIEVSSDLELARIVAFRDFTRGGAAVAPYDDHGHGTHVAGLIGGDGSLSARRYQGVAPGTRLIGLKVLDRTGAGLTSTVVEAIEFAIDHKDDLGIHIINLSLGHPILEPAVTDPLVLAVERAVAEGIVVVVSGGNDGVNPETGRPGYAGITSPGNARSAITIGAVDTAQTVSRGDDTVAPYSSRGPSWYDAHGKPDLVAPGHALVASAALNGTLYEQYPNARVVGITLPARYMRLSGTSMAAAVATGVVALLLEASRSVSDGLLSPNAVKAVLQFTAFPVAGCDELTQGAGALNASGAVTLASAIDPTRAMGEPWLTRGVTPTTTIGTSILVWTQKVLWGDNTVWGDSVYTHEAAWAINIVWGAGIGWSPNIVWGASFVWEDIVWGQNIVWGNDAVGMRDGDNIVWGAGVDWSRVTPSNIVWGATSGDGIGARNIVWGSGGGGL